MILHMRAMGAVFWLACGLFDLGLGGLQVAWAGPGTAQTDKPTSGSLAPLQVVAATAPTALLASCETAQGRLQAWAVPVADGKKTELIGRVVDRGGKVVGATHLVRRTSGRVTDVKLVERNGQVYLGWASIVESEGGKPSSVLVAVQRTNLDLSAASQPVTLVHGGKVSTEEDTTEDGRRLGPTLHLLTPARGGVAVAYYNATAPESAWAAYVSETLDAQKLGSVRADGGDGSFGGMIDLGKGVLLWTFAWRGGGTWGQAFFPYVPSEEAPRLSLPDCHPPMEYHFNGAELTAYCPSDYRRAGESCPLAGSTDDLCARLFVQRLDGTVLTKGKKRGTVPVLKRQVTCEQGRWVRRLTWNGGSVALDPETATGGVPVCKAGDKAPAFRR